jgi:hypothetical protein
MVRTSGNQMLILSERNLEICRRVGIVVGGISAPVFSAVVFGLADFSWSSFVPYALLTPGLLVAGYCLAMLLVRSIFWCIDASNAA